MKKQTFLDHEPQNIKEWFTQQLLTMLTKTELQRIGGTLRKLEVVAYKTASKELPLEEVVKCVNIAEELAVKGETDKITLNEVKNENKLENTKEVGGRGHGGAAK